MGKDQFKKPVQNQNQNGHLKKAKQDKQKAKLKAKLKDKLRSAISTDAAYKSNEFQDAPPKQDIPKKKKKKTVQKNFETFESASKTSKLVDVPDESIKLKRKKDETKVSADTDKKAKKRLKTVGGFVETNADDDEETKLVTEKLKKKKPKLADISAKKSDKKSANVDGPKIRVHNVEEDQINCSNGSNSDSEDDSYIDKFFHNGDNDFDEDHIYSLDEIESKQDNDFLSKASGTKKKRKKGTAKNADLSKKKSDSPKNKLIDYENNAQENDIMWPQEIDYTDSDYDFNMMYGTDSEISLGSEVSDSSDTYECESTDIDSSDMEEYEDDSTYVPTSDSEYEHGEDESVSSGDTYDDFLHSKYYDDGHSHSDSSNDHEYKDECYDDLRIPQGTAVTYKITDKRIKLFENDTESRILEIPKTDSDNDSCVELVSINVKRSKLLRQEKENMIIKENKRKEEKLLEENKRLAYEKSVQDYYDMDNFKKTDSTERKKKESVEDVSVAVIKCQKTTSQSSLDWLEIDEDSKSSEEDNDLIYPKMSTGNVTVIPINDPTKKESKCIQSPKSHIKIGENMDQFVANSVNGEQDSENFTGSEYETEGERGEENSISTPTEDMEPESNDFVKFVNSLNSRHVLLLLRGTLHFHGSLHIKLIAGKAIAFGHDLQPNKTFTVHSPRGHGLICLISRPSESLEQYSLKAIDNLKDVFHSQDIESMKDAFNRATDAILLLERDRTNRGVNMIERYMRETVFPNINAFNNESPYYSSEFVLRCKFLHSPENGLVLNDEWLTLNLKTHSKLVAIGGKGVGKSTFVRYLINTNLAKFKKFLFIDLDIGQPELFLPQTLSVTVITEPILGPGYLQNVQPAKAVWFGDINVLPDPVKYWRCVQNIYNFCSSSADYSNIPWVINTMGYSRGFGTELIACILKIFKPTNLVQIQSRIAADNFDQIMKADVVNNFKYNVLQNEMAQIDGDCRHKTHIFNAARDKIHHKQVDMTAKDIRYTMILAKLGNCLKSNSDWLTSVKPFEASLDDLTILVTNGEEISSSEYLELLNGNLVYLCEKRPDNTIDIVDCHGIGIVRGVNPLTNKLYLLSTIPLNELRRVSVLAIGTIPLPSAVFLNQHNQIRGTVPYVYNSDKFVGSKQVVQHIFRAECRSNNKPIKLMED